MGFSRLCEMYLPNESLDRASFAPVVLDSSPPKRYGFVNLLPLRSIFTPLTTNKHQSNIQCF
ncbi:unnamed protein product [Brassica rapa subsp. narinosa]